MGPSGMATAPPADSAMAATLAVSGLSVDWRADASRSGVAIVLGGDLLPLPVHAGGLSVVNLHAVHADVALARARVAGDDAGEGDEAAAVMRPALEDGKVVEVEVVEANTFLAGGVFGADGFGEGAGERAQLREHFELVEKAFRGFSGSSAYESVRRFRQAVPTPRASAMRRSLPN